jgi:hypothetical protein
MMMMVRKNSMKILNCLMSCNVNMMKSWIYYSLKKSLKTSLNLSYGCMKNLRSDCKSWRMNSLSKNMMTGSKMMKMTLSLKNLRNLNKMRS